MILRVGRKRRADWERSHPGGSGTKESISLLPVMIKGDSRELGVWVSTARTGLLVEE